jgi:acyl-CoA synthetase (AMP-forming)/AMP-acid ligase II
VAADTLARFAAAFRPYGFRAEALAPVYGLAECSVGLAVGPPGRGPVIDRVQREALAAGEAVARRPSMTIQRCAWWPAASPARP